jgi:hypothetical protein
MKLEKKFAYELSLVSYFDILGMKDLLRRAADDANVIGGVLETFKSYSEPDEPSTDTWEWKFVNFSDLVVRSVPISSESNKRYRLGLVFHETSALARIQANLASRKVLVRGGITIGNIAINHGLVFGPALASAYELESKQARFPRLIIDDVVLSEMKENSLLRANTYENEMSYVGQIVKRDTDDVLFVDYLGYMLTSSDDKREHFEFLAGHKLLVVEQLAEIACLDHSSEVYKSRLDKARWLSDYHNSHIRALEEQRFMGSRDVEASMLYI